MVGEDAGVAGTAVRPAGERAVEVEDDGPNHVPIVSPGRDTSAAGVPPSGPVHAVILLVMAAEEPTPPGDHVPDAPDRRAQAGGAAHALGSRARRRRRRCRGRGDPAPDVRRRHLLHPVGLHGADAADRRPHRGRQAGLPPPRRRHGQHHRLRDPATEDCAGPPVADLVKRVIGLPGQTVSLSRGHVLIDGKLLAQPWLPACRAHGTYLGPPSSPTPAPSLRRPAGRRLRHG